MSTRDPNHLLLRAVQHLDADERDALLRDLAAHAPALARDLELSEHAVASIALALPPTAPPPELRARLVERLTSIPRADRIEPAALPLPRPAPHITPWLRYAAALLIGVGLGITAWHLSVTRPAKQELAQTKSLLASPDTALILFKGQPAQPNARGRVFVDKTRRELQIHLFDLKPPPANRTYELWLFPDKSAAPLPSQTFTVDAAGRATLTVPLPANLPTLAAAAISDEPLGGSPSPTGQIHLMGAID